MIVTSCEPAGKSGAVEVKVVSVNGDGWRPIEHDPDVCGLSHDYEPDLCPACAIQRRTREQATIRDERRSTCRREFRKIDPALVRAMRTVARQEIRRGVAPEISALTDAVLRLEGRP